MEKINDISQLDLSNYVQHGDLVVWGQAQAEPTPLTQNLMQNRKKIGKFKVFLGISTFPTCTPESAAEIEYISYCGAGYNRCLAQQQLLHILPSHYSQLPQLIAQQQLKIDVVLIQVSAPNQYGQYSYSLAQDYLKSAIQHARIVIAEVNQQAPWVYSDHYLTDADFDVMFYSNRTILASDPPTDSEVSRKIAQQVAMHIQDGATLQLGIGALPEAILQALQQHRQLGIHSGIIGDGVAQLMQTGVITNEKKSIDRAKTITGLIAGSTELHQFIHQNPAIELRATQYTHHPTVLAALPQFTAINSAIEIDLTGQVNAEIANHTYVGAVGGALDFIRAANQSSGGVSIIALPAAGKGFSRIVNKLQGPASTPRSDVGLIVTEYGVADLRGLTLAQRVEKMLSIAHPDYQSMLAQQAQY
ncbi:acetyl-CoA hydrolase/transferase family protein [Acinetobacter pullicarnis]|uniref:acetyl-CoA hydrolase/transferase family protein n=1 Tax=Acinetobacter pullicarnis TaxID=2576829 RepID=UPI00111D99F9|nr:acetyl-CoA hydrolase/transferase C-terminal domain-containing protein [Acinetobacter pullicarnis]